MNCPIPSEAQLVESVIPWIRAEIGRLYGLPNLQQPADCEDAFQVGLIAALESARQYRGGTSFLTFCRSKIRWRLLTHAGDPRYPKPDHQDTASDMFDCLQAVAARPEYSDLHLDLADALRFLPKRYRKLIALRYGLLDGDPWTQADLAKLYGTSQKYIAEVEAECLDTLRKRMESYQ